MASLIANTSFEVAGIEEGAMIEVSRETKGFWFINTDKAEVKVSKKTGMATTYWTKDHAHFPNSLDRQKIGFEFTEWTRAA